jgi:hypothetical protein
MLSLTQEELDSTEMQVGKLIEAIQQQSNGARDLNSTKHSARSVRLEGRSCQERNKKNWGTHLTV